MSGVTGRKTCYRSDDIKIVSTCCNKPYFAPRQIFETWNQEEIYFICPHCGWKSSCVYKRKFAL